MKGKMKDIESIEKVQRATKQIKQIRRLSYRGRLKDRTYWHPVTDDMIKDFRISHHTYDADVSEGILHLS